MAQEVPGPGPVAPDPSDDEQPHSDIVVIGQRGSAVTDLPPLAEFDAAAVAATGATTIPELLQAIRGSTQGADGAEPILLLNAQRVSGYAEIASLPPEAIEKVEVMPEQAALKFGFPPTRRLVNFITKARFRQLEVKASAGTATRGGTTMQKANVGLTRLNHGARLTLGLELRRTDALLQSDRTILPDPDVPFDAIGNITGVGGGEIDPALSTAAGQVVTIAPVPVASADRDLLAAYAAAGNRPRLFDPSPYRTLAPGTEAIKAEAVIADRIGETMSGSISLSAGHSRDRSLLGPAGVRLSIPAGNPYSPFGGPAVLNRYLIEAAPLGQTQEVTDLSAGALLRGATAGWRWDVTANFDQKRTAAVVDRGFDVAAANDAIAAGADPFAPLSPELRTLLVDRIVQRTRTTSAKAVATNAPVRLPAGKVTVTATAEVSRDGAVSSLRGSLPSDLSLARTRVEGGLAIDVPLTSRRENVLSFVGDLSVNASVNVRHVGGFGSLDDSVLGLSWGPFKGVQFIAALRRSATAPDMAQQSTPVTRVPNVPVFDFGTGRTEITTLVTGGNPDLLAERRLVRSFTVSLKPFAKREWRINATYAATTIRDQTGTVQAITPQTDAILPDLFVRDANDRLTSVIYQPINFDVEEVRTLNLTVNVNGQFAKAPAAAGKPPRSSTYYGGIGPSLKFSDRLQLRPGTPELDLLAGDTVRGWGMPRFYGYAYGGINHRGMGLTFNAWYQAPNRILSDDPAGNLRFSSLFKLNLGAYVGLGEVLKDQKWARKLRLGLDIDNATDARQRVTDGNGLVPNRFQRDYMEPVGRTVTLSLRRLF